MERHSYDPAHRGYYEAFARDWGVATDMRLSAVDLNEMKSMNTHLHVMEAFTNLLRVWPDALLRARQAELIDVMMTHVINPETAQMIFFFNEAWEARSHHISYGHDIEASWLLVESTGVLGDPVLDARAKALSVRMAHAVYEQGLDPDGGIVYERGPEGLTDSTKQWWPQAEAAVGFLNAYQLSGESQFLDAALGSWAFIETHLVDREHGEWLRYVERDLTRPLGSGENNAKVSFWKCPYHNGRACMELTERLRKLIETF